MNTIIDTQLSKISSFKDILNPITVDQFLEEFWEKKLLILERNNPDYYKSLFSIQKVDEVLDLSRPKGGSIRVVKNQDPLLPTKYENLDGSLNLNQLYAAYADGYTIVINELNRFWNPVKEFCLNMSHTLSHHSRANMYLTPKNEKALLPHYDTHDVYVLQVYGEKNWILYDAPMETPLLNSQQPIFKREQLRNPREITLRAGDMMYMPRGLPHEAYTTDQSSLHITVGSYPAQWLDLLTKAIQQLAYNDLELRKALPAGYLNASIWTPEFTASFTAKFQELLASVAARSEAFTGVGLLSEEERSKQSLKGDGHFFNIDQINTLDLDTRVCKRDGIKCNVQLYGPFCRIIFQGNVIKGPSRIQESLKFIANSSAPFHVRDITGLSDNNKVKLVARLVRGGLLRLV